MIPEPCGFIGGIWNKMDKESAVMEENPKEEKSIETSGGKRRFFIALALGVSLIILGVLIVFAAVRINRNPKNDDVAAGEWTESEEKSTVYEKESTKSVGDKTSSPTKNMGTEAGEENSATTNDANMQTTVSENTAATDDKTTSGQTKEPAVTESAQTTQPSTEQKTESLNKPGTDEVKPSTGEQNTQATLPPETSGSQIPSGSVEEKARYYVSKMTTEEKVAGLFFVHPEVINGGLQADESTKAALSRYPVGGVIYFGNNIQSEAQLTSLLAKTKEYSKYPIFLGVDEEGGRVARVAQAFDSVQNTGDAASLGASGDPASAYGAYSKIGAYLTKYGFNVDFAPVADIYNESNSMFEKRSFGKDAKLVSDYVYQAVKGLQDKGISACAKHFPGHGSTKGDSHNGMAVSMLTMDELLSRELLPFKSAMSASVDFIMMGHISLPNVLPDNTPATLSYDIITGILRNKLGYNGIVITDAMRMSAVSTMYSSADAAVMAIKAGCDMVLMPVDFNEAYQGVLNAVYSGEISIERIDESLMRIYRVKCRNM